MNLLHAQERLRNLIVSEQLTSAQLQQCIDEGADKDGPSAAGSPLSLAICSNNVTAVKLLIDAGARVYPEHLFLASNGGHLSIPVLLNAGVSIECRDDKGHTPLMRAVRNGDKAAVDVLLRAGAKV